MAQVVPQSAEGATGSSGQAHSAARSHTQAPTHAPVQVVQDVRARLAPLGTARARTATVEPSGRRI